MNHKGTIRLETERLILRRFEAKDSEDMYYNVASDPMVNKFLTWPLHKCISDTILLLERWTEQYQDSERYRWAIELKEIGRVIGIIASPTVKNRTDTVDITYCIGSKWWGQGFVVEALKVIIDFFFEEVKVNRIEAGYDENNPSSGRVMEKIGMKKEGVIRQAGRNNQGIFDIVQCSILRKEWKEVLQSETDV